MKLTTAINILNISDITSKEEIQSAHKRDTLKYCDPDSLCEIEMTKLINVACETLIRKARYINEHPVLRDLMIK